MHPDSPRPLNIVSLEIAEHLKMRMSRVEEEGTLNTNDVIVLAELLRIN